MRARALSSCAVTMSIGTFLSAGCSRIERATEMPSALAQAVLDEDRIVGLAARTRRPKRASASSPSGSPVGMNAPRFEGPVKDLSVRVVFDDQNARAAQVGQRRARGDRARPDERHREEEGRTEARLAVDADLAFHQWHAA